MVTPQVCVLYKRDKYLRFFFLGFDIEVKPWSILCYFQLLASFHDRFKAVGGIFILIVNIFCACLKIDIKKVPLKFQTSYKSNAKYSLRSIFMD